MRELIEQMHEPDNQADEPTNATGETGGGSIFGNLPKERPGARSPRRAAGESASAKATAKPKQAKQAKRPAPPRPAPVASTPPPPPPPPTSGGRPAVAEPPMRREGTDQIGGIEDLAWAGVTVAAQAATLGVKLASKAFEAVRKSVDRP